MRLSELFSKTSKTLPADEPSRNAQLLIQAGFIHKEMAGVYAYLPLGKIVLDKIAQIVREEMNAIGGNEVQMTVLQPKDIWQQTGRWDEAAVDIWLKTKLQSGSQLGLGWTHEEPITAMLRDHVSSYKDMPVYIYQIQSKFRNELRAKSGLLRGREFLMKDLYSFSPDQASHERFYEKAAAAYLNVYQRLGIGGVTYRTFASGGAFSEFSDEFQTVSPVGEDTIYLDKTKGIGINKEVFNDSVLKKLGLNRNELVEERAVEVGNIFSLGTKYSDDLGLHYSDEAGRQREIIMGCYGIGISRLMGLIAEHFADDKGLIWPPTIAPAQVHLLSLGGQADTKAAEQLYSSLTSQKVSVIYDDRDLRAGEKFADADLIGIPYRLVISDQTLSTGKYELKPRASHKAQLVSMSQLVEALGKN